MEKIVYGRRRRHDIDPLQLDVSDNRQISGNVQGQKVNHLKISELQSSVETSDESDLIKILKHINMTIINYIHVIYKSKQILFTFTLLNILNSLMHLKT